MPTFRHKIGQVAESCAGDIWWPKRGPRSSRRPLASKGLCYRAVQPVHSDRWRPLTRCTAKRHNGAVSVTESGEESRHQKGLFWDMPRGRWLFGSPNDHLA